MQEIPTTSRSSNASIANFTYKGKGRQASSAADSAESTRIARPGEKITYLYRVAPGSSLRSHAAHCAEIYGLPKPVVERAQYISELITTHQVRRPLDDSMTEEEQKDLEDAEAVFKSFWIGGWTRRRTSRLTFSGSLGRILATRRPL